MEGNDHSDYLKKFERTVIGVLIVMMSLVIVLSVIELAWLLIKDIITPPVILLAVDELIEIFAMFLLVLIGIELIETLKLYLRQNVVRAEVIILVALIALSRKVITLDFKEIPGISVLSIAALIAALSIAYYIIKRAHHSYET